MVNLIVLSHKDLRLTPFNRLLAGLAVADCLLSMEYIPFSLHMNIWDPESRDQQERVRIKRVNVSMDQMEKISAQYSFQC